MLDGVTVFPTDYPDNIVTADTVIGTFSPAGILVCNGPIDIDKDTIVLIPALNMQVRIPFGSCCVCPMP